MNAKLAGLLFENLAAHDVARQQVDGELHARETQIDGLGHRLHQQRLGNSRNAFEQQMSAREQRDEHALNHDFLSDHCARNLRANVIDKG